MGTAASPAFDTEALRRGIEGQDAAALLSLYADDAELRVVDHKTQPSHPMVMHGRGEIGAMLTEVYGRDMTHKLEQVVVQGDQVAYTESCLYPDGVRVLAGSMMSLRDGKIVDQTVLQAWDEEDS
ncbi:nuclear transport factor 2 family protein [Streptomyces sp. WI04-05B]|uniref:nuclear transport factor 2 family protein n=1 Tax=Streptomyces TaxID=1883 RepID=UPI0029BF13D8|nr:MULTISPECIES: nuclear transport factor 2 family protein [unclassified Streptomyces]MDX2545981.1 nuclear transport factor 2 family protein [Streptomyces sp. WI04-05B]MDX2582718.1 nuclear transport factor 2 family protein [Streptomyces sp. WI04-05A]MDX3746967.1 nuclear transport factor 2 family protein [Streptomyces sp. AK08-02]